MYWEHWGRVALTAVPIPVPGRLVPIEEAVQELPDELVGTQITFELAEEDHPPEYE